MTADQSESSTRIERDSMGEMSVPQWALWGASTQRAKENFPISGRGVPSSIIHAFGLLKAACAQVNRDLGKLPADIADAVIAAAREVASGQLDEHFVVDVYQTGSGTSSNMNANEVIANRATALLGARHVHAGLQETADVRIHPNDHVNMGQSSNDTFPTAFHVAAAKAIQHELIPALRWLHETLDHKAKQWDDIIKVGRTHLMDATPIRVGQVFSGYAEQAGLAAGRAHKAVQALSELAIGGTAVGTGINTHPEFGSRVAQRLSEDVGVTFAEASNHPEAQAAKDSVVEVSGQLKTIAVSLSKIASDIRLLGSGPRCGIGELKLPAIQPGSSIMPGKVNPVLCESVVQVACRVIGNDATVTTAALGGVGSIFELNVAMPVMADALMESITLLANVSNVFVEKLLIGLEVDEDRCRELLEKSLMMVTALAPSPPGIGYDKAAAIAKRALKENRTIRELVREEGLLGDTTLDELLDPEKMTRPG